MPQSRTKMNLVCYQKMNTVWSFVVRAFLLALLSSLALPTGSYSAYVLKDGQNDEQYSLLNSKTDENTNNVPKIIDNRLIQVLKKSTEEVRRRVKRPSVGGFDNIDVAISTLDLLQNKGHRGHRRWPMRPKLSVTGVKMSDLARLLKHGRRR